MRERWPQAGPSFRSNNREALACASGAAVLPRIIGDALLLQRLERETPPSRDIWLGYHQDLKRLRRLRSLVEHLSAVLPSEI